MKKIVLINVAALILLIVVCAATIRPRSTMVDVQQFGSFSAAKNYTEKMYSDGWTLKSWQVDKIHFLVFEKIE